ncbi:MAG: L-threonylcarbamoyladenylate synthase [Acidithiobacillus ferriphilus]|jgi:tRNA threonylcarbamoyl adenosine modification protein (Sua5/YciO/YrdC/YwlC family)|uniref:YrdC-like domain-containing protein n=3 Tax=Acidithiobacillus TaxID=119977 RepID=A0A179BNU5_ACIFR|nr:MULTISPECIES: L-threonylcarbamoyladenylate synthase [Acidithiobacillus]OYV81983.1 MAG: threonylcarbamoyl-AMP synthase [Acidithiobacillus ferrivorans]MBU2786439.1 threonylcarbamoyl-AMP synthase [Acidithiobacillus ferriphilus]MBU2827743.1 threonylcarbamoyl-AMP synthase [Acidithiobacillus ferriphilus]MBU2829932.1 threonylcarbamoyl-AMP synthase [Acidithiobacillus ferriphilus]MBU2831810.1 threonylcarbamoyl-AMP synthase [Acidithiobacillus ferriphilus]
MALCIELHPVNPQPRLLVQAVEVLRAGGLLVYPTDTCYALGCMIAARESQERLRRIRQLDLQHDLSLLFSSISQLADYAKLDDRAYALLRKTLPGPYTFILPATKDVPRRLADPRKRSIGVRIPKNPLCENLITDLGEPLMSSTLQLPGASAPLTDPDEICEALGNQVDMVLLSGVGGVLCSTVVDLLQWPPRVLREGSGDPGLLGLSVAVQCPMPH